MDKTFAEVMQNVIVSMQKAISQAREKSPEVADDMAIMAAEDMLATTKVITGKACLKY